MWAMKGGHWWWLGFGSMWGGTWKLRGTGGWLQVLCKLGRGRGPWQPTESLMKAPGSQDIKSRVCGMFTTQGRSWMQLRMKLPPRTDGEYFPHHCQSTQSRMLTEPTGAKKKKKKSCKLPWDRAFKGLRAESHKAGGISKNAKKSTTFARKARKGKQAQDGRA